MDTAKEQLPQQICTIMWHPRSPPLWIT